ncbi:MAG TPA: hypothetical protein VNQ97_01210 [Burkholderiaceae bacterium]|nr:hypothetical protein [Burkholderiaceae bacterium]
MTMHHRTFTRAAAALCVAGLIPLAGCSPMLAGQMAEAGYNVAKTSLGQPDLSAKGADERQRKLQSILNQVEVGQDLQPILQSMEEPPKEKSGNAYGYTCYEYPAVYSSTESAVIMARNGKVAFFGNSRCNVEMKDVNFNEGGKYKVGAEPVSRSISVPAEN